MDMSKLIKLQTHPGNLYWDPNMYIVASIKCRVEITGTCTHPRGTLHAVPVPCRFRRGFLASRHRREGAVQGREREKTAVAGLGIECSVLGLLVDC